MYPGSQVGAWCCEVGCQAAPVQVKVRVPVWPLDLTSSGCRLQQVPTRPNYFPCSARSHKS